MESSKKRNKYLHKKEANEESDWLVDEESPEVEKTKWYDEIPSVKEYPECKESEIVSLKIEAQTVLKKEEEIFSKKGGNGRTDKAWLRTVMAKGTASDKIAAFVISIQDSPVYNLAAIRNLVSSVKVSKKKECLSVMETLTELFLSDLLRPDVKLRTFDRQPLSLLADLSSGNAMTRRRLLCHWLFEDQLKTLYAQFVTALDSVSRDTVDAHRERAVTAMYKLLAGNPEQEDVLLRNLVNKLGDPSQKVVSKVIYSLTQLLRVHPVMKQVVANEIEKFLFRANIGPRAQYYAICFLSQYIFSTEDFQLAENIISIYFSFFKANIKKGQIDSRMMSALLMGVNRAYLFAKMEEGELREHVDTMYKLVHVCAFNVSLQTLTLLYQILGHSTDRFYCALYKKLLDPHLTSSAHQAMFINLVFKALKNDTNIGRVRVFIKRLLQVCLSSPSQLSCALLYLVSELISRRPQLLALQTHGQEEGAEGGDVGGSSDDDGDEHYSDAPLEPKLAAIVRPTDNEVTEVKEEKKPRPSWYHCKTNAVKVQKRVFDAQARNPAFAGGKFAAYEELTALSTHFHPTVSLFAKTILDKQPVKYTGDPLQDFTLLRFLERFVFKNPKRLAPEDKGPDPCLAPRRRYQASGARAVGVTSAAYLGQEERQVPVDEIFLYRYLQKRKPSVNVKREEEDSDVDSVCSEEFNDLLDNMGIGKVDEDLDFADDVGNKLRSKPKSKARGKGNESESDEGMSESEHEAESDEEMTDLEEGEEDEEVTDLEEEDGNEDATDLEGEDEGSDAEAIDFGEDVEDFDEEIDFDNLGSDDEDEDPEDRTLHKTVKKSKSKLGGKGIHSMFAPAEKFAEMLEEAGSSRLKLGTAQAVSNKDNAAVKQLEWESKRNSWSHRGNKRKRFSKGPVKPNFNKSKRKKVKK